MTTPVSSGRSLQLSDLEGRATISVEEAAELLGLGRTAAYRAAQLGELPSFKIGRRVLVPVPRLRAMLEAAE